MQRSRSLGDFWVVSLLSTFVYLVTADFRVPQSIDTSAATVASWRLVFFHTLRFSESAGNRWLQLGPDGYYSNRSPGIIALGAPFQLVFGSSAGRSQTGAVVLGAVGTSLAVGFLYLVAVQLVSRRAAWATCLVGGFGTCSWAVSSADAWTHGWSQAVILAAVLGASRSKWHWAGLAWALGALLRPHLALMGLFSTAYISWKSRRIGPLAVVSAQIIGALIVLVAYIHFIWGTWGFSAPGYDSRLTNGEGLPSISVFFTDFLGTLISPERGIFLISPFLVVLALGIPEAWRNSPQWVKASAIGAVPYLLVQLILNPFHGGSSFFGYRLMLEPLTALSPLLILCWKYCFQGDRTRQAIFSAAAAISVSIQVVGVVGISTYIFPVGPWESWSVLLYVALKGPAIASVAACVGVLVYVFLDDGPKKDSGMSRQTVSESHP